MSRRLQKLSAGTLVAGVLSILLACDGPPVSPPVISDEGPLTDEQVDCARQWRERSLPPDLEAAVPPDIRPQPSLRAIHAWNGGVVALSREMAYRVDVESRRLIPLEFPACASVLDLGETPDSLFALCSQGGLYVMERDKGRGGKWVTILDVPEQAPLLTDRALDSLRGSYDPQAGARLVVSEYAVGVIGRETFWWRSATDAEWRTSSPLFAEMPQPGVEEEWKYVETRSPPRALLSTSDSLFIGWNFGERGAWLYRMKIGRDGHPTGEPELLTGQFPVHSLVEGKGGEVWVGGGTSHMGSASGQVLRVKNRTVRTVLYEYSAQCGPGRGELSLPQAATIRGLTVDGAGRPLIVADDLGVFRISEDSIEPLIQKQMAPRYAATYSGHKGTQQTVPAGIVATEGGILVASSSLGVFAFLEEDGGYEFSQIVLR